MFQEIGKSIVFEHVISHKVKETQITKELGKIGLDHIEYIHTYSIFYKKSKTFFLGDEKIIYLDRIKFKCIHPLDYVKVNMILEKVNKKLNKRLSKEPMKKLIKEFLEEYNKIDDYSEEWVIKYEEMKKIEEEIKKEIRELIDKSCKKVNFKLGLSRKIFIEDNMIYIPRN